MVVGSCEELGRSCGGRSCESNGRVCGAATVMDRVWKTGGACGRDVGGMGGWLGRGAAVKVEVLSGSSRPKSCACRRAPGACQAARDAPSPQRPPLHPLRCGPGNARGQLPILLCLRCGDLCLCTLERPPETPPLQPTPRSSTPHHPPWSPPYSSVATRSSQRRPNSLS